VELQVSAAQEVARVLKGEWPLSMVNPEVRERITIMGREDSQRQVRIPGRRYD